jgi:hypothetical protein
VSGSQLLYLLGAILTFAGAYLTARLGAKANAAKVVADKEVGAGQLALNIATRLDAELIDLRRQLTHVRRWWPKHEDWDDRLVEELERHDPGALDRLGKPPRLPLEQED